MIDAWATQSHYRTYLERALTHVPRAQILDTAPVAPGRPVLIAGYRDADTVHPSRPLALIEHGAGQTYRDVAHPGYAGGPGWDRLSLVLAPGPHAARSWRVAYPQLRVVEFGTFHDVFIARPLPRTVAVATFHWDCTQTVETRTAWPDWRAQLTQLAASRRFQLLGHWHPRWDRHPRRGPNQLAAWWTQLGVRHVTVEELFDRAGLLVADNASLLYEFAATGRPVLCLNGRSWRRDVEHGLRFWSHPPGHMLDPGDDLATGIEAARTDWELTKELRDAAVAQTYAPPRGDMARQRAAHALIDWAAAIPPRTTG